jgi:hypothetical protein
MKHGTHSGAKKCKCEVCVNFLREYMRAWRSANPEKTRKAGRRNMEAKRARDRLRWAEDEDYRKRKYMQRRLSRYGLTPEQYASLLAAQGGLCAICRTATPGAMGEWKIDHDHSCCPGRSKKSCGDCVRELLCNNCNVGIGMLKDSPELLMSARDYLAAYITIRKLR